MENFSDIITANEDNRKRVLAEIIKSGVQIPCIDGVIISEEAEIEANAVILPNTQIYGKAKICANAEVGPGSIVEDCIIGENAKVIASHCYRSEIKSGAEIGPFVRIRPDCTIGENARVGNFVELKNAEVRKGAKISHLSYIGDSEVGEDVNIGCGCATVNFDGRNKNRTVICDGAFIGCGVNLVAPVEVGKDAFVAAGSTVTEDVPENSLAIARSRQVNKEDWVTRKKPYKRMK
ncbi:MAG: UDP-N-acetylglucosamine diphosphorylase [Clostridia bacterium]|nr:UDP-N-acetylglucosamine diphosphorylase [Clostridia bacterium]